MIKVILRIGLYLSVFRPSSYFLSNFEAGNQRDPSNLPSLGAMGWGGENLVPSLLSGAPQPLLSGLLRFLAVSHEVFNTLSNKVCMLTYHVSSILFFLLISLI